MARYSASLNKTTAAAAGPVVTLSTGTARDISVYEVGVFATTAVAGEVALGRPANTPATPSGGGVGAALDTISGAGVAVIANTWGTAPTAATMPWRRAQLPATIGAGIIWTFPSATTSTSITTSEIARRVAAWRWHVGHHLGDP
jgi:hypothetical protein